MTGGEESAVDEAGACGELGAAYSGEHGCGGDVDAGVDEGGADAFGEVFEQVGALGTAGGAGVEPVDLVDHHQLDPGGGVGVADGGCDLGLGHAGGGGDAEVAGELEGEGFRAGGGWDQDVGDGDLPGGGCMAVASGVGEVAGASDLEQGGGFPGAGGSGDDEGGPCGHRLVASEGHQGAHVLGECVDGRGAYGDEPRVVGQALFEAAGRCAGWGRGCRGCGGEGVKAVPGGC